jgi:alkanesulfonate monooxygenase SsuD/methylene tetrahydromethanopterin reductase-like flavin-dependent oxidoreductase (luciferase family)
MGDASTTDAIVPLEGTPETIAEELRAYAAEGIGHVQLVLDPISRDSIERFAPVVRLLAADRS